ncbi:centrosome and spindle pole-associated protein 1 [Polymixia lowei]
MTEDDTNTRTCDDFGFQLGEEYKKKKQKLQEELRLDYRLYVTKKKDLKTRDPFSQPQNLSLPIEERRTAKDKLRDERHKEYNIFLNEQAGLGRLKRQTSQMTSQVQTSNALCICSPTSPLPIPGARANVHPSHRERLPSRRDASTLTEAAGTGSRPGARGDEPPGRRRWGLPRSEDLLEHLERRPRRHKGQRVEYSSEEDLNTDEEEDLEFARGRRRDRHNREPEYTERRKGRTRQPRADRALHGRALQDTKTVEAPGVHDQHNRNWIRKSHLQMPDSMRTTERSRSAASKDKAEFATGLLIGTVEGNAASQMRKDRYRQELLEQMAEQQRNKRKERELELRVAATGAVDPEKKPDRIKQFGAVNREYGGWRRDVPYRPGMGVDASGNDPSPGPRDNKPSAGAEERGPAGRPHVAFPSPTALDYSLALAQLAGRTVPGAGTGTGAAPGVPGLSSVNEDFHRSLSNTLGEMAAPRLAGIPPPVPPTISDTYRTPYDEAYFYYGARNPLDPSLPSYGPPGGIRQQSVVIPNLPQGAPPPAPSYRSGATSQHEALPSAIGALPGEKSKQTRENALSYQEALRRQEEIRREQSQHFYKIKETEERKRREREERERYDARIQAEMKAYDPWGRSGGGAPIKDQRGHLVSDLNQMHRTNEQAYMNPKSRVKDRPPSTHRISGFPFAAETSPFTDQPPTQQDSYRDFLKQQIEEKKRKQAEERERIRMEEEREEKRQAEQRARMQQEYEEEQQKTRKKAIEQSLANKELIRRAEERRGEQERRKKLGDRQKPRPPTAESRLSSGAASERSTPAPQSPPVPARRNQLRAKEDQQGVIYELSALRRHLRSEQRRLAGQLVQTHREETDTPLPARRRGLPKVDVFDMARIHAAQGSTRRAHSGATHVNMQNIREFNQLKYRDTASRQEVRHAYPDPPSDADTLDVQQQALLREQQRVIRTMRRREDDDHIDRPQNHRRPRDNPALNCQRDTLLASESAFIDCWGASDTFPEPVRKQRSPQSSAEDTQRRRDYQDEAVRPDGQREYDIQPDARPPGSEPSPTSERGRAPHQHRIRRPGHLGHDHNRRAEGLSGGEGDTVSLPSTPCAPGGRVSAETVATEPWLRPGTSGAAKPPGHGEKPTGRDAKEPAWDGPSTYHG